MVVVPSRTVASPDIKPAATILLLRDAPDFEVLMVKRHHQIDFASGALVFPGGKSHAGDHDPAWVDHALGWSEFDAEQRGLRIAAIREVFEEAGVLLGRRLDGSAIGGEACPLDVRKAWLHDTVATFEESGIGWALWDWKGDFGVVDRAMRPTGIHEALFLR